MTDRQKTVVHILFSFLVLLGVSAYSLFARSSNPDGQLRPVIVCAVLLLLLAHWAMSIKDRITQFNMRHFLLAEDSLMIFWVIIRFIQDFFLSHETYTLRVSNYLMAIPMVLLPLLSFYASLGLGKTENFMINWKWRLLLIPAVALILFMLTNESHQIIFFKFPGEPVNLSYHPSLYIIFFIAWGVVFEFLRIYLIFHKTRALERASTSSAAMVILIGLVVLLVLMITMPYLANAFTDYYMENIIETAFALFYLEVLVWEICIWLGLVPVNSEYAMVFNRSTLNLQVLDEDGESIVRSPRATEVSPSMLEEMKRKGVIMGAELPVSEYELHLHQLEDDTYLVWQKDVTKIQSVIRGLQDAVNELSKEGTLLSEEVKAKSEEAKVNAQNEIYDRLGQEVGSQITLIQKVLKTRHKGGDPEAILRKVALVGTYIKRRCNLRLIEQETHTIVNADLEFSFRDLLSCIAQMGIPSAMDWRLTDDLSPEFSLATYDVFEQLLEQEQLSPASVRISMTEDGTFLADVSHGVYTLKNERLNQYIRNMDPAYSILIQDTRGGYHLTFREGRLD